MDIISQYANREAVDQKFSENPVLGRFAHEFCHAFNCRVSDAENMRNSVLVETPNGLYGGRLRVDPRGALDKDSNPIPVYFYSSNLVGKEKGSSRAGRNERDSTKISTLISAVRRNKEDPTDGKLANTFKRGIGYAVSTTQFARRAPSIDLDGNVTLALLESALGVDTERVKLHTAALQEAYKKFRFSLKEVKEADETNQRFSQGCYAIGIMAKGEGRPQHYLFTEVAGSDRDSIVFQAPVKRYSTLRDVPELAGHLPIIKAWAEGALPDFKDDNDLGLPARDVFYRDIDVASGYERHQELWVIIPKTAP